jgi:orotidine-5'-phosphate decarboxylase
MQLTQITAKERLIVALDVPNAAAAQRIVHNIGDAASFYKVGLQLFAAEGPKLVCDLRESGKKIFLDLKFHDIPNTVASAVKSVIELGCSMLTVHASGGRKMLQAAVEASASAPRPLTLLAVTILTSMADDDLAEVGMPVGAWDHAIALGKLAIHSGFNGLVASPQEVQELRSILGPNISIVTPGIRPAGSHAGDQARVATPQDAIRRGADYLVVGRPITESLDPASAAKSIVQEIENAYV